MSHFGMSGHARFRVMTTKGTQAADGQIVRILPAAQSHRLHVRQRDACVRMPYEASTRSQRLQLAAA